MKKLSNKHFTHWIGATAVLAILILLIYRRYAFTNLVIGRGDSYFYFYPYWTMAIEAFRAGQIPTWNPDLFMGTPLVANSQVGFFYPLNWPLWAFLSAPYAVTATILLHLLIAAVGTYWVARKAFNLSFTSAVLAGALFSLTGFMTAQVEHVNQAQGLAYLPWLVGVCTGWATAVSDWRKLVLKAGGIALLFSLQLLSGHTQTTFITGIAITVWTAFQLIYGLIDIWNEKRVKIETYPPQKSTSIKEAIRLVFGTVVTSIIGVVLALGIAAVQLLPTLELTGLSRRQGGLTLGEATSFSLHPALLARALLPGYEQTQYAEYIAYLPLGGMLLAIIGIATVRKKRWAWPAVLLVILGLLFALGEYTPVYMNVVETVPGFDLFRAPARWTVLYTFAAALLAGIGWERLGHINYLDKIRIPSVITIFIILGLIILVPYADYRGMTDVPMPPESPAQNAVYQLFVGWGAELIVLIGFCFLLRKNSHLWRYLLLVPMLLSLVFAANTIQRSALTAPEAYFDIRQSVAWLQSIAAEKEATNQPKDRYLSISKGNFVAGDQGEIESIYNDQLSEESLYEYTVSAKNREIIAPNLNLVYGLSSVDGFDGGLLPLYDYAATAGLMLPDGVETVDGRLRQLLEQVPEAKWLDLFGVRHVVTDKIGDPWLFVGDLGAMFDLTHRTVLQPGESLTVGYLPEFESTELWIASEGTAGTVTVSAGAASDSWTPEYVTDVIAKAKWSEPGIPDGLTLTAGSEPWVVAGLVLMNSNNTHFRTIIPGEYRLALSGDVKIYENMDVMPRAMLFNEWEYRATVDEAVEQIGIEGYDIRKRIVIQGEGDLTSSEEQVGDAVVLYYDNERIVIQTNTPSEQYLLLTEAYYPGWTATIDGQPTSIERADGMFRAVKVPAGTHEVAFDFEPTSLKMGLMASGGSALLLAAACGFCFFTRKENTKDVNYDWNWS